jgi:hypothetical protein
VSPVQLEVGRGLEKKRSGSPEGCLTWRKVLFEKAGHYPLLEHAEKVNQVVLEFLKSQS